jgi:hypothetical protein
MSTVYQRQIPDYSKYRARLAVRQDFLKTISPMGTISNAEEIAGAVVHLTETGNVTRQVLQLDGVESRGNQEQLVDI